MPRLSCWFIRASLLYLAVGLTAGALLLFHKGNVLHPLLWRLLPLHIEFLLLGWTLQLAMGVALWILPRYVHGRGRGHEAAAWLAFALLNVGVLMVSLAWLLGEAGWMPFLGRVSEAGGAMVFVLHVWPRIPPLAA